MHVCVITVELHLPMANSLKAKRSVVQGIVRSLDRWTSVAAAEVDHLDTWQRAAIGVTVISSSPGRVREVADRVERLIWSQPDITVLSVDTDWWEPSS